MSKRVITPDAFSWTMKSLLTFSCILYISFIGSISEVSVHGPLVYCFKTYKSRTPWQNSVLSELLLSRKPGEIHRERGRERGGRREGDGRQRQSGGDGEEQRKKDMAISAGHQLWTKRTLQGFQLHLTSCRCHHLPIPIC